MKTMYFVRSGEVEPTTQTPPPTETPIGSTYPPVDEENIPVDDDTTDLGHRGYANYGQ